MIATALIAAVISAVSGTPAARAASAGAGVRDARVTGTFTMRARITAAVNVAGERPGEVLTRRWVIVPRDCHGNVCPSLELDRQRSDGRYSQVTLRRIGPGRYAGSGAFWVALACKGHVDPHGSRAPYLITMSISRVASVGGVRFALGIDAGYVNLERSDATSCPLGPSDDAATYSGRVIAGLPTAPVASFTARVHRRTGRVRFRGTSKPGRGNGRIVSRAWLFGDPRSPYGNTSNREHPSHVYTKPGRYRVTLRIVTADGLSATTTRTIRVRRRHRRARRPAARSSRAPRRAR